MVKEYRGKYGFETLVRKVAAICHPLRLDGTNKSSESPLKKLKHEIDGLFKTKNRICSSPTFDISFNSSIQLHWTFV